MKLNMRIIGLIGVVAALMLAACSGDDTPTPADTPTPIVITVAGTPVVVTATPAPTTVPIPTPDPRYGGVIKLGHIVDPSSIDPRVTSSPQTVNMIGPIYSRLFRPDPEDNSKIVGDVMSDWEVDGGGTTYTLTLRPNVRWHDGRQMTAGDVKGSIEVMTDPETGGSNSIRLLSDVEAIEVVDPLTLRIKLTRPVPSMIARVSTHFTMLVPKHVLDAGGELEDNLVGTGAFKWVSYRRGASLKMERHPDYHHEGLPYLDGVEIFPVAEQATRMAAIRAGNIDQFTRWASLTGQAALSIKAAEPRIIIDPLQRASVGNLIFETTQEPWNDVRARRAVSLAFDRQKAIAVVGGGLGTLAVMPFLGEFATPQDDLIQRPGYRQPKDEDIAEAQRLWQAAGITKELDLVITVRAGTVFHENLGVFVKSELDEVFGVNVTVRAIEFVAFQKLYRAGGYGIITATASNGIPTDPDGIAIHMGNSGALNYQTPQRVLDLFDQQSGSTDSVERLRLVREIQEVWLEEVPAVAAFLVTLAQPRWDYVRNFEPGFSVYNQTPYDTVWLAEK